MKTLFGDMDGATPMMAQYLKIKAEHQDCLLFYRMGDFYEMFFEDARQASEALDIALTKRGTHNDNPIPMCGVPVHAAESYLNKLTTQGFRVAVCEQMENPQEARKRGGHKAVVQRAVTRIVTQGTLSEDALLDARAHNFLLALTRTARRWGCAWVDMSTGIVMTQPLAEEDVATVLSRINPSEILIPASLAGSLSEHAHIQELPDARFDMNSAEQRLLQFYRIASLDAFGDFSPPEIAALGCLLDYIHLTQKDATPRLASPRQVSPGHILIMDPATLRNLEIFTTLSGRHQGSLIASIDATITAPGARLLRARLAAPSRDRTEIETRLDGIEIFTDPDMRQTIRQHLRACPDIERALSRLFLGRGSPRDLMAIARGLQAGALIRTTLSQAPPALKSNPIPLKALESIDPIAHDILKALKDEPPINFREGNFIQDGYAPELDEFRTLRNESQRLIANLESRYRKDSGIDTLRIKHNNILGWFLEIHTRFADRLDENFIHRQTLSSSARYTTGELVELARKITDAEEHTLALELELYEILVQHTLERAEVISAAAGVLAQIDWASALAEIAATRNYTRPHLDSGNVLRITAGRHPVVEQALDREQTAFIPNDCAITRDERLWLLSGPNMAGKSTFLRQNALMVVMAQAGCFVPAEQCTLGLVDRLFSRVGASDDLARGRSTFMVEMMESATILRQATAQSMVILDEIGRGTATFDGLSIAWAAVEYLHDRIDCRALFATHYHELGHLCAQLPRLAPYTMTVKEWQGQVVFLHAISPGFAESSYGIHVAQLAGLPGAVIQRAQAILASLEQGERAQSLAKLTGEIPLLTAAAPDPHSPVLERLQALNPDTLSPKEALEVLYELKRLTQS